MSTRSGRGRPPRSLQPSTSNLESSTSNSDPSTSNPEPSTSNPEVASGMTMTSSVVDHVSTEVVRILQSEFAKLAEILRPSNQSGESCRNNNSHNINNDNSAMGNRGAIVENDVTSKALASFRVEYKLTNKVRFDVWYDNFVSELSALNLMDVIEDRELPPLNQTPDMIRRRKEQVRFLLINRIDDTYHNYIVNIRDPKEALQRIKDFRKAEINTTSATLMKDLEDLRFRKGQESVAEFIARFESSVQKYEMVCKPVENEVKCTRFTIAVRESYDQFELTAGNRNITENYDALLKLALFFESSEREANKLRITNKNNSLGSVMALGRNRWSRSRQYNSRPFRSPYPQHGNFDRFRERRDRNRRDRRCYVCGGSGHEAANCHVDPDSGIKLCYKCHKLTTHLAKDCGGKIERKVNKVDESSDKNEGNEKRKYIPKTGVSKRPQYFKNKNKN